MATSGVRGFALTLGLGTIVSFFTAVLFTQAVIGTAGRTRLLRSRDAVGAAKAKRPISFDFVGASRWFFSMSGVILVICALALGGKGIEFGIDFESGTRITAPLAQPASEDQVRQVLGGAGLADAEVQRVNTPGASANTVQISTEALTPAEIDQVSGVLDQRFGGGERFSATSIGPTFGQTVAQSAIVAVIASLLLVAVYITLRFEWKYAMPILIALSHDLLITAGVYALIGAEVTTATVAALLTILGFSLYDTIIVFDRIRENVPRMPRAAFSQIVNRSMSEVIVRSIVTSFCTLLPVIALYAFGGETLRDFALALIIGTASGTYSSVFIASQVLNAWKEREPVYRRRRIRLERELGEVPAYPVATAGGQIDVEPDSPRRAPSRRVTSPDDPQRGVSPSEWQEMMRDIREETRAPTATAEPEERERTRGRDLSPEEIVMPGEVKGERKQRRSGGSSSQRSRRHGRNR